MSHIDHMSQVIVTQSHIVQKNIEGFEIIIISHILIIYNIYSL